MSPYTTFKNEDVIYKHRNGEVLVQADTASGRRFVAVTRDGYRTDYPILSGFVTLWDNPEWFTKGFRHAVTKAIIRSKPRRVL